MAPFFFTCRSWERGTQKGDSLPVRDWGPALANGKQQIRGWPGLKLTYREGQLQWVLPRMKYLQTFVLPPLALALLRRARAIRAFEDVFSLSCPVLQRPPLAVGLSSKNTARQMIRPNWAPKFTSTKHNYPFAQPHYHTHCTSCIYASGSAGPPVSLPGKTLFCPPGRESYSACEHKHLSSTEGAPNQPPFAPAAEDRFLEVVSCLVLQALGISRTALGRQSKSHPRNPPAKGGGKKVLSVRISVSGTISVLISA